MYLCNTMKFFKPVLALLAVISLLTSCKNDLKLNAPYKEIPSIFAVLNPQDKIQIIRINKVFLGETDANQMAQVADSINYPEGELEVSLTRKNTYGVALPAAKSGAMTIFFRDSVIQAQAGAFNKTQRVYVTSEELFTTDIYKLTVKNKHTGNVFTASATALDNIFNAFYNPTTGLSGQIIPPYAFAQPFYPYAPLGPPKDNSAHFMDFRAGGPIVYRPSEAKCGKIYNLVMRFHFYDSLFNGNKVFRYVDYKFGNQTIKDVQKKAGIDVLVNDFKSADLFGGIAVALSKMGLSNDIPGRKMHRLEFLVYSSSQEYADYMQYVSPSLSISQSKPLYSNFDNQAALGLFTFRSSSSTTKQMKNEFINEFAYNSFTCGYQFMTSANFLPGCN